MVQVAILLGSNVRNMIKGLAVIAVLCSACYAQEASSLASLQPNIMEPSPMVRVALPEAPKPHGFWDKQNRILFTAVAALNAADFAATRSNLQSGGKELNPVTRLFAGSTAGLAANFAGETAGVIGMSYLFHRTGHHKLERVTSMMCIGTSGFAVSYDLSHRH